MAQEPNDLEHIATGDAIADLLVSGKASTVAEAEEMYLDSHIEDVLRLVDSPLSDDEFRRHPLIVLLLARGSRPLEDSIA